MALDIGCCEKRFNYRPSIGIDIVANKNVDIVADAHHLPFKEATFDTVIAGELIEHLINPAQFLSELKYVLKLGGRVILTTPNPWSITYVIREWLGINSLSTLPEHKHLWDAQLLKKFLESCGLIVDFIGYVNGSRNWILKILRRAIKRWSIQIFVIAKKD